MSADQLAAAQEVFYTTKPQGTGLGLAVVKSVTLAHGGRFRLQSRQGVGPCGVLTVPLVGSYEDNHYLPRAIRGASAPLLVYGRTPMNHPSSLNPAILLVVEDDPDLREALVDTLQLADFDVEEADCAERALEILDEHRDIAM